MSFSRILGRLLQLDSGQSVEQIRPALGAPWAQDAPAAVFFGCLLLAGLGVWFYLKGQPARRKPTRIFLAASRAAVLCALLLVLAEPILNVRVAGRLRPSLWLLFDGTDSMNLVDEEPAATGKSRLDQVKAWLDGQQGQELFRKLDEQFRLRAFLFKRSDGVIPLALSSGSHGRSDPEFLAGQLTADGTVTALGAALDDLGRRADTGRASGVVIVSDFNQNAGPTPVAAARRLATRMFTIGVGAVATVDASVTIQSPLVVKREERAAITILLRQRGLTGQLAQVTLSVEQDNATGASSEPVVVGRRRIALSQEVSPLEFSWVPDRAGRATLLAQVEPLTGERVVENNLAKREITVRDDFLRVLYVEYEPTYEWRFIKEVFHRDKLVGMQGFRTFLRSSDPKVRRPGSLFVPTMTLPRSEFFAYDVILLGDLPETVLGRQFCEMVEEFVRNFGGGLVVTAGPRFGAGQLTSTPLAELLPVKLDPAAPIRVRSPFRLAMTPLAAEYDFLQLGGDEAENRKAWNNLELLWYQPVERLHPLAAALAEHPQELCTDGKTHQPLMAIRRYGRGEVVYLGFNETWRLRRLYGELYYRQFWGQLIHRLGLSHALGSQKRFLVETDRREYQPDDQVTATVEVWDADFRPLAETQLPDRRIRAELVLPGRDASGSTTLQPLRLAQVRPGVFEARATVLSGGEYRLRAFDPITGSPVETSFQVTRGNVEREKAVRNVALQEALAAETGGRGFDLSNADSLPDTVLKDPKTETSLRVVPLWNTWPCFVLVVGLLLAEWFVRKRVNLP